MVEKCLFSIIIPVYNSGLYLTRCLDSVFRQGMDDGCFEVVAINDGSEDHSLLILMNYAERHHNIKVITQTNRGVSYARNVGINNARGEYLVFLDADDEICEGALESVFEYLCGSFHPDFLETVQVRHYDSCDHISRVSPLVEGKEYTGVSAFQFGHIRTNAGGAIVRRRLLISNSLFFPEGIKNGEDSVFFAIAQSFAESIVFCNLVFYRIHLVKNSASRSSFETKAIDLCQTVNYAHSLRHNLLAENNEGLLEFITYQMLSNAVYCFTASPNLHYSDLKKRVNINDVLPINVKNVYIGKRKAMLMNFSFTLFYFLSWCQSHLHRF